MQHLCRRSTFILLLALLASILPVATPARAATTLTVTSAADSGAGSLRDIIGQANNPANTEPITINFNIAGTNTINITSAQLPTLTRSNVTINGTNQNGGARIILDGTNNNFFGLSISGANNTVNKFVIINFGESSGNDVAGIQITGEDADNNTIDDVYAGVDSTGTSGAAFANDTGFRISDGADSNVIKNSVASGNNRYGIVIARATNSNDLTGNRVESSRIGTTPDGTAARPNTFSGIFIGGSSTDTIIGGASSAQGNIISGHTTTANVSAGITVNQQPSGGPTTISFNLIGTNAAGNAAIPNRVGIDLNTGQGVTISNNTISGNTEFGIDVPQATSGGHTITGNTIGLSADRSAAVPNGSDVTTQAGIRIRANGAGAATAASTISGNVIAGNAGSGILLFGSRVAGTIIRGNTIGGTGGLRNQNAGIELACGVDNAGPSGVVIGGTLSDPAQRNVIIGNGSSGILIYGSSGNQVLGNYIGVAADGATAAGNGSGGAGITLLDGVTILSSPGANTTTIPANCQSSAAPAQNNSIGGANDQGNLISANSLAGVRVQGRTDALGNQVLSNTIGLNLARSAALANASNGVQITSADNTVVQGNSIGGNSGAGIVTTAGTGTFVDTPTGTTISYNRIGLVDSLGASNNSFGINLIAPTTGASAIVRPFNMTIGPDNRIAGNRGIGVNIGRFITGARVTQSRIYDNNTSGTAQNLVLVAGTNPGNTGIAAPALPGSGYDQGTQTLSGTATCPSAPCTVEIHSTDRNSIAAGESKLYVASTTTNGGSFSIALAGAARLRYLVATITDNAGNTSQFSGYVDAGTPSVPSAGLDFRAANPNSQAITAGASVTFNHILRNNGSIAGDYTLAIVSPPGSGFSATVAPQTVRLEANQETTVQVTVTAPASPTPGTYNTTVRATVNDGTNPSSSADQTDSVTLAEQRSFTLTPQGVSRGSAASTGVKVNYTYTLTNTGNRTETFAIAISDRQVLNGPAGTGITINDLLSNVSFDVAAGATRTFVVGVVIPADATQSVITTSVTVRATGTGAPAAQTVIQETSVTQNPVPAWSGNGTGSTPPNTGISYNLTLTNQGNSAGSFTMSADPASAAGWQFSFAPATVSLGSRESANVTVTVTPSLLISGTVLVVNLRATSNAGTSAETPIRTTVTGVGGFDFGPPEASSQSIVPPGTFFDYSHAITNTGNVTETFILNSVVVAGDPNASVSFSTGSTVLVPPFSSQPIVVRVTVGATASQPFITTRVTASATSGFQSPTARSVEQTTFLKPVPIPRWSANQRGAALPGEAITYTLSLTNSGLVSGNFTVTLQAPPATLGQFRVEPTVQDQPFAVGAAQNLTVVVTPNEVLSGTEIVLTLLATTNEGNDAQANVTTVVKQVARVALGDDGTRSVAPGRAVNFSNTVTNTGNGLDTFSFTSEGGIPGVISTVEVPQPIQLNPGLSAPALARYTIVPGAPAGTYERRLTATSQANPAVQASVVNTITVISAPVPQIQPLGPQSGKAGTQVSFTHAITNVGNATGLFTLTVGILPPEIQSLTITPTGPFTLDRFGNGTFSSQVQLTFTISPTARVGSYSVPVTLEGGGLTDTVNDVINVQLTPGVAITSAREGPQAGLPGQTLTFSHILTNTGNGRDTFSVTLNSSLPGWTIAGDRLLALDPGQNTVVLVSVQVPFGVPAFVTNTIRVVATSLADLTVRATGIAEAGILPAPALQISPTVSVKPGPIGGSVQHTFLLSNTGNVTSSYLLTQTNTLTWPVTLVPTTTGLIPPFTGLQVTLNVSVPAGTPEQTSNRTTIVVGSSQGLSATAVATTTAARPFDLRFTANEESSIPPGQTAIYTHYLTNTGLFTDSYELSALSNLGWQISAAPALIENLTPGASITVTVRVTAPARVAATRSTPPIFDPHITTVRVTSIGDPRVTAQVTDTTSVAQIAGVDLSPRRTRQVQPGEVLIYRHTVRNLGNGFDRYTFSASSSRGWPVTLDVQTTPAIAPSGLLGFDASSSYEISVTVRVPTTALEGTIDSLTITATSQLNPQVSSSVVNRSIIPITLSAQPPPAPTERFILRFPFIRS